MNSSQTLRLYYLRRYLSQTFLIPQWVNLFVVFLYFLQFCGLVLVFFPYFPGRTDGPALVQVEMPFWSRKESYTLLWRFL